MALKIISRDEWGARKPDAIYRMRTPVGRVFVHHSAGPAGDGSLASEAALVRGIQAFHMRPVAQHGRGWSDIGYSFLVGSSGLVYVGRGWQRIGAHTYGHNSTALGICFMGNTENIMPTAAAIRAYAELIREGIRRGFIRRDVKISGHRDVKATACPGRNLYAKLPDIRRRVRMTVKFRVMWNGKVVHEPTLNAALQRARAVLPGAGAVHIRKVEVS